MHKSDSDGHLDLPASKLPDSLPLLDECEDFSFVEVSPYDDDGNIDAMLATYDFSYILRLLRQIAHLYPKVLDVELEDIAQDVSIHFWQRLLQGPIRNPKAYIAMMLRNRCMDSVRIITRLAYPQSLPLADNGELQEEHIVNQLYEGMADPADVVEQQIAAFDCLNELAKAIVALHPRQKRAIVCLFVEHIDDLLQLTQVLRDNQIQFEAGWPSNEAERHLLKASLSAARDNIAKYLNMDITSYKRAKRKAKSPNNTHVKTSTRRLSLAS
jgi:RNA polymerase sigma factor (sigma-70 family)